MKCANCTGGVNLVGDSHHSVTQAPTFSRVGACRSHSAERLFLVGNVLLYCVAVPAPFSVPRQSVPLKVQLNVLLLIVATMLN